MTTVVPIDEIDKLFPKSKDGILRQAKDRFERCEKWESSTRKAFLNDVKFANADSDNGYQWPDKLKQNRDVDQRPNLTINKTRQHNLQIKNEAKQNKPSIKFRPTGGGATYDSAEILESIVRHIEYISKATNAYGTAVSFQVDGGIGYLRVVTDYLDQETFDQDIFIRGVRDPLTVYLDPDAQEPDKSDGRFGFVFDDMPKDEFKHAYPKYAAAAGQAALGKGDGWCDADHVRVCEYFRLIEKSDKLVALPGPDGNKKLYKKSELDNEVHKAIVDDPTYEARDITYNVVEWNLIVGNQVVETKTWPGKYIPIVPVIGEETVINGILDRKGHTRNLKDAQRMLNYWSSAAVEQVALQGKSPYIAPAKAIEGYETYWMSANTVNHSVLPYNAMDDDGNKIDAPTRARPPEMAQAYVEGLAMSREQMMEVSGQYQSSMGKESNERSGKAINARQSQGDNATYHFVDNFATALRHVGVIILDLIPKVYDTQRVIQIMAEDGKESEITIDPNAQQAFLAKQQGDVQQILFNPNVGKYAVQADVGPNYATKRQEGFNAFSQIITQAPDTLHLIGDLMFKNADFPGADKIAERLQRLVPPEAMGEGPPAIQVKLQGQLAASQKLLQTTLDEMAEMRLKLKGKDEMREIDVYDAITKRIAVLIKEEMTPRQVATMTHDLVTAEHQSTLTATSAATSEDIGATIDGNKASPDVTADPAQGQQQPPAPWQP